jgi:hypothetical protein
MNLAAPDAQPVEPIYAAHLFPGLLAAAMSWLRRVMRELGTGNR